MYFYLLIVLLLAVGFNEGKNCSSNQGSLTFLTSTIKFPSAQGVSDSFNGAISNSICKNNSLQTICYNSVANKQSIGKVVCSKNICICNYDDNYCYKANKTSGYVLDYLFYSYNGYIYINPNTGGQKLERTVGKRSFEHKTTADMKLSPNTTSYLHGKALLVGCTTCDKLHANNALLKC
uniref:Uncharacterized protein n=1 Tax=Meloidogyne incognita TaxID=6306 RepID=A0A914KNC4_MELIC